MCRGWTMARGALEEVILVYVHQSSGHFWILTEGVQVFSVFGHCGVNTVWHNYNHKLALLYVEIVYVQ